MGLSVVPAAPAHLEWDRQAIEAGQYWRLLTGHSVHWSLAHLGWDAVAFVMLGAGCERLAPRRFLACSLVSAVLIGLGLWQLRPDLAAYRGLSGVDSALFTMLAATRLRAGEKAVPILAYLVLFTGKLCFEALTGSALFVPVQLVGATPVPLAHLIGGTVGVAFGAAPDSARRGVSVGQVVGS
ncbi:MAG TPA: rhombosortase [Methylomirabilota bacterium]|nr:rhombosortase [Methylomirabilota bacterium]